VAYTYLTDKPKAKVNGNEDGIKIVLI
jgi:hypothetical protein